MDTGLHASEPSIVPRELTGTIPRNLRASGSTVYLTIVAVIFFAAGAAYAFWYGSSAVKQIQQREELRRGGIGAVGEITRLWTPGRALHEEVRYTFTVKGTTFKGEAAVPTHLLHDLVGSDSLPIRYLPTNPIVNHPAAWEWSERWDSIFGTLLWLGIGLLLFVPLRRARRIVAEGTPVLGRCTRCSRGPRGSFRIDYEFRTNDGAVMQGSSICDHPQEVGARVCILYLPQNPRRSQMYPLLNYRVIG